MSIQGFRRFLVGGPFLKAILYILIGVFVIGLAAIFVPGSGILPSERERQQTSTGSGDVIAKINGKPLTREAYDQLYTEQARQMISLYAQFGQPVGVDQLWTIRLEALQGATDQQLLLAEAAAQGIRVSKRDVRRKIDQLVDLQMDQLKQGAKGADLEQRFGMIYSQTTSTPRATMSERQFRKWMTEYLRERYTDQVTTELITSQLRDKVTPKPKVSEAEVRASYDRLTLRTLLVALKPVGKPERTDEQARARATELMARLKQGADFAELAKAESDDAMTKQTGGVRENVLPTSLPPDWQKAVASLKPGEVAPEPIKEGNGYTIVKLEKVTQALPKDFEKNKQQEMDRLALRKQSEAWSKYQEGLRAKAKIQVLDPEMLGYEALQAGKTDEAIAELKKATSSAENIGPAGAASVYYQLAKYYAAHTQWKEAASAYESADSYLAREESGLSGARMDTLMGMARSYQNLGNTSEALVWYRAASDAADTPTVHQQLMAVYEQLGQTQDAEHERQWLANFSKQQAEQQEAQRRAMEAQQKAAAEKAGGAKPAPAPSAAAPQPPAPPARKPAAKPAAPAPAERPAASTPTPAPAGAAPSPAPAAGK
jgi:parvulin-like peptidyl-prolyl isomerase